MRWVGASLAALLAAGALYATLRAPTNGLVVFHGPRGRELGGGRAREGQLSTAASPLFDMAALTLGSACACSDVTGLTTARGSTAYCTKASVSSFASGDLVACATNKPLVMPGGDGTGGVGILNESAGAAVPLYGEQFDNAAWTKEGSGTSASVGANDSTGPDGTSTADRIVLAATGVGAYSDLYQSFSVANNAATTCSYYVKGRLGTSGTADVCMYDGAAWVCADCAFTGTTARCEKRVAAGTGTARYCKFGNSTSINGGTTRSANDVDAWGGVGEASPYATSYMQAVGSSGARSAASVTASVTVPAAATVALKATYVAPPTFTATRTVAQLYFDASNWVGGYVTSTHATTSTFTCNFRIGGADSTVASVATMTSGASNVVACYYDGVNKAACVGGTCNTSAASLTLPSGAATLYIGGRQAGAGFEANGVVKGLCVSSALATCGVTP